MVIDFFELGTEISENDLSIERLLRINKALKSHSCYSIISYIRFNTPCAADMEGIVVECQNDKIPQDLLKIILYKERLLIYSGQSDKEGPGVKCLRKNFPKGIHQNLTGPNDPVDLCLSNQSWEDQRRSWSAILFLDKILWWLENFAKNTIHAADQPLEPPFFSSSITLICPSTISVLKPDEYELVSATGWDKEKPDSKMFLRFKTLKNNKDTNDKKFFFLRFECKCVEHGVINNPPATLGELSVILKKLGIEIWPEIKNEIIRLFRIDKNIPETTSRLFLIITFPQSESRTGRLNNFTFAFILEKGLGSIGLENDFLAKAPDSSQSITPVTILSQETTNWQTIPVALANVVMENTNLALSIYNNVSESGFSTIKPLLIGCGSLGGHLLTQFFRMGFNDWVVIDNDYFLPHNIARHFLLNCYYGYSKTEAASHLLGLLSDEEKTSTFRCSSASEIVWGKDYCDRNLIIDASTTLSVPRDLSLNPDVPRCVSVFFSPSGLDSVILSEDRHRHIRLDSLEAQYYKWVISQDNEEHLASESGVQYANGCRDISGKIPLPYVFIHSGILATQLLSLAKEENALIGICRIQKSTYAVTQEGFKPSCVKETIVDDWKIIVAADVESFAFKMRKSKLPDETGGIILGYLDRVASKIYVVDLLQAPQDSQSSKVAFQRGIIGVEATLNAASKKTNGIVNYIGEWHSHPQGCSTMPSHMDKEQLSWCCQKLNYLDQPALMMIIGESSINYVLQK